MVFCRCYKDAFHRVMFCLKFFKVVKTVPASHCSTVSIINAHINVNKSRRQVSYGETVLCNEKFSLAALL